MAGYHGYVNQVKIQETNRNAIAKMHQSTRLNALTNGQGTFMIGAAAVAGLLLLNGPQVNSYIYQHHELCKLLNISAKQTQLVSFGMQEVKQ